MKVFVTKYALSEGILEIEPNHAQDGFISWKNPDDMFPTYAYGEGKQWHRTREAALVMAEQMRQRKIASLRKSIAKLEALKFT